MLGISQFRLFSQEMSHPYDTVHGRSNFVAHICKEHTLCLASGLCYLLCRNQCRFSFSPFGDITNKCADVQIAFILEEGNRQFNRK